MSGWHVMCLACDWSIVVDDMADGADKADAHLDICDGHPPVNPFDGLGGAA